MQTIDVLVIGAGAAGLMCAIEAGKRGRRVRLIDHASKLAEKIRISGGGRCNFTNIHAAPDNYISANPHFCKSALKQYTPNDFVALVNRHRIAFHEKDLGQLFCNDRAQDIIDMLVVEAKQAGVEPELQMDVISIEKSDEGFVVGLRDQRSASVHNVLCAALVMATGGLSIPKIGATKFGYEVAQKFDHSIVETRAALVPLTFQTTVLERCKLLSGVSLKAVVSCRAKSFSEAMLFTHRGLSGPSILQISSYWREGLEIEVNMAPDCAVGAFLVEAKEGGGKQNLENILAEILPRRLAQDICVAKSLKGRLSEISNAKLGEIGDAINCWRLMPAGSEGYRTAEVTLGGVDTRELSSQTMESKKVKGLFFIGELVDVTGQLGGYNFQWAWSSGFVAGQYA